MIKVDNLRKSYKKQEVLKGVTFSIDECNVTGIVGPNACGKTTLIKCILGLVVPDAGDIYVENKKINGLWKYREAIGYLPQNPDFPTNLRVGEIFSMLEDIRKVPARSKDELIRTFVLESAIEKPFGFLSGGTRQKVGLVASLMFDPKLLIFDEPTVGLDPIASVQFKKCVEARVKAGSTVLLVSHMMSEIEQLATKMIFLLDGGVRFSGDLNALRQTSGEQSLDRAVFKLLSSGASA